MPPIDYFVTICRFRFRFRCLCLIALLFAFPALAQQVSVNVEGDHPQLKANAEAFIGDVEGRSADNLRRYASTAVSQAERALRAVVVRYSSASCGPREDPRAYPERTQGSP